MPLLGVAFAVAGLPFDVDGLSFVLLVDVFAFITISEKKEGLRVETRM